MANALKLGQEIRFAGQIKFTVYETYPSVFIKKWLNNALPKNLKFSAFFLVLSTRSLPFVVF